MVTQHVSSTRLAAEVRDAPEDNTVRAVRLFHAVFGGKHADVDELASDDVVVTYPVFQRLLSRPAVRGREALTAFAARFSTTWTDARMTIEETVSEGNTVVLMWSFTARNTGPGASGQPPSNKEASWGGITLNRFDEHGKITAEIGEESPPRAGRTAEGVKHRTRHLRSASLREPPNFAIMMVT